MADLAGELRNIGLRGFDLFAVFAQRRAGALISALATEQGDAGQL